MTEDQKKEIRKMIQQELKRFLPELLGKSLVQIKQFFIKNII
jgi:recombinational DNA repair protein (RecF pathway)